MTTPQDKPSPTVDKAAAQDNVVLVLRGPDGKIKQEQAA